MLGGELAEIYPGSRVESAELANTRVMPARTEVIPNSLTAPTRVMTTQIGVSISQPKSAPADRWRFPIKVALIALAAVLIAALLISIVLALSQLTPT